jgi:hypothetical protein
MPFSQRRSRHPGLTAHCQEEYRTCRHQAPSIQVMVTGG